MSSLNSQKKKSSLTYSLRSILLNAKIDVSKIKIYLDTSILTSSNINLRDTKYFLQTWLEIFDLLNVQLENILSIWETSDYIFTDSELREKHLDFPGIF
jgi:hypothetical protein